MCEIFGGSFRKPFAVNDYLETFFGHSDQHPHGWGLACMEGNEVSVEKEPVKAKRSQYLKHRLFAVVEPLVVMAHIRYATIGNVMYHNCHPYVKKDHCGRNWVFVHNGTIFEFADLNPYVKQQTGDTDSERILLYLVDKVEDAEDALGRPMNREERFLLLAERIADLAKNNKLNLLLYDGEQLYVHTNYRDSLYYLKTGSGLLFATQPLSQEAWKPVPFTTVLACSDGEIAFRGENHGNEYVDSEENMKYLYQIFSDL